jgi:hypothetical protein
VRVRLWNLSILLAFGLFWLAADTQHEKAALAASPDLDVRALEAALRRAPTDGPATRALAQAYLQSRVPGLAVALLDRAPEALRAELETQHLYARVLLDQGRASAALAVETKVATACETQRGPLDARGSQTLHEPASADEPLVHEVECSSFLQVSAVRRLTLIRELVDLGIEDPAAYPEKAALAYQRVTRDARIVP